MSNDCGHYDCGVAPTDGCSGGNEHQNGIDKPNEIDSPPEREITIRDRKPLDPDGKHILAIRTVYNAQQASTQTIGLTTDELYELFCVAAGRLGVASYLHLTTPHKHEGH